MCSITPPARWPSHGTRWTSPATRRSRPLHFPRCAPRLAAADCSETWASAHKPLSPPARRSHPPAAEPSPENTPVEEPISPPQRQTAALGHRRWSDSDRHGPTVCCATGISDIHKFSPCRYSNQQSISMLWSTLSTYITRTEKKDHIFTCKWLFTSSFVRPSTFINSLICFGVAAANIEFIKLILVIRY